MAGFVDALNAKKYTAMCSYLLPGSQSKCRSDFGPVSPSELAEKMPFTRNAGLGYVAIDGTRALIGTTGEYCAPVQSPECFTNNSPAAVLDSRKSFSALRKTAVAETNDPSSSNVYTLSPAWRSAGNGTPTCLSREGRGLNTP
jgi:hypothetical protein